MLHYFGLLQDFAYYFLNEPNQIPIEFDQEVVSKKAAALPPKPMPKSLAQGGERASSAQRPGSKQSLASKNTSVSSKASTNSKARGRSVAPKAPKTTMKRSWEQRADRMAN